MATEEITISELELADEILGDMNIPVDTATETRAVTLKQLRAWLGSSLPTGFIIPAVGKISDERFTLLDGKTLSREGTYLAFCNKVVAEVQAGNWFACSEEEYNQDISDFGQCGKFVVSNDYVRIPTITRFIGATVTLSEIGKTYKESLPNITGVSAFGATSSEAGTYKNSGSIEWGTSTSNGISGNGTGSGILREKVNASKSSSTYQDGAKVQPDHTKYPYYMVISTEGQTAPVEIDINKVYEDMNLKANTSLSNVASNIDYVVEQGEINNINWEKWKSGKLIQRGSITTSQDATITFPKPYANTDYAAFMTPRRSDNTRIAICAIQNTTMSTTSMVCLAGDLTASLSWMTIGQGA